VSEDAAATARRIVAEVLAEAGIDEDDSRPAVPTPSRDDAEKGPPEAEGAPSLAGDAQWDDDPGVVARRIVEQVLGSASGLSTARTGEGPPEPPTAPEAPEPRPAAAAGGPAREADPVGEGAAPGVAAPAVEARVGHVPAEGLPADGTDAADVAVVAEVPDDSLSAADIVRRIVAEVTSASDAAPTSPPSSPGSDEPLPSHEQDESPTPKERPADPPPAPVGERGGDEADEAPPAPVDEREVVESDDEEGPPPPPRSEPTRELALDEPTETEPTREVPAGRDALDSEPTREVRLRPDTGTTRDASPGGGALESEPTREVRLRPDGGDPEPTREVPVRRDDAGDAGDRAQAGTTSGTDDEDQHETLWPEARDRGGRATPGDRSGEPHSTTGAAPGEPEGSRPPTSEAAAPGPHRTEAGISLLDREAETEPEPEDEDDGGFEAVVPQPATVGSHWEPLVAPPTEVPGEAQAQPHTLRWLLISVLGAVALAVLLPLTVAALRSLVSVG
jgi:hypothetical protein